MRDIFPEIHSFSPTNLKYMRYFYELYPNPVNRPQLEDDLEQGENSPRLEDNSSELPVFYIPWGHNKVIIDKCRHNPDKALFYVKITGHN